VNAVTEIHPSHFTISCAPSDSSRSAAARRVRVNGPLQCQFWRRGEKMRMGTHRLFLFFILDTATTPTVMTTTTTTIAPTPSDARMIIVSSANKAAIDRRLRPRCCHLGSYFERPRKVVPCVRWPAAGTTAHVYSQAQGCVQLGGDVE